MHQSMSKSASESGVRVTTVLNTLLLDDGANTVEEPLELWVGRSLVVDELDLDSFHRSHNQDGLGEASPEAAEQTLGRAQLALFVDAELLELLESTKPDKMKWNFIFLNMLLI